VLVADVGDGYLYSGFWIKAQSTELAKQYELLHMVLGDTTHFAIPFAYLLTMS
jgi:hypothetical protein